MYKGKIPMFKKNLGPHQSWWFNRGLCHDVDITRDTDWYDTRCDYIDNAPFQATLTVASYYRAGTKVGVIVKDETGCGFYMFISGLLDAIEKYGAAPGSVMTGTWCFAKIGTAIGLVPAD